MLARLSRSLSLRVEGSISKNVSKGQQSSDDYLSRAGRTTSTRHDTHTHTPTRVHSARARTRTHLARSKRLSTYAPHVCRDPCMRPSASDPQPQPFQLGLPPREPTARRTCTDHHMLHRCSELSVAHKQYLEIYSHPLMHVTHSFGLHTTSCIDDVVPAVPHPHCQRKGERGSQSPQLPHSPPVSAPPNHVPNHSSGFE